jgi:N-acetylmuramoyl-L-alanine amidase
MNKFLLGILTATVLLFSGCATAPPRPYPAKPYPAAKAAPITRVQKVALDPGHGGPDPGAIGRSFGLREKDVNLDIARRAAELLRREGVQVVMTRANDSFIPLAKRAAIANSAGADIFLSIHSNANRSRHLSGFEAYYVSPNVSDAKRALSAAKGPLPKLESSCFGGNSPQLRAIIWEMSYASARAESIEMSRAACRWAREIAGAETLGVKGARFVVLREARTPAALLEVGFLSNPQDERRLSNPVYRQQIAEAIVEGIREYSQKARLVGGRK